MATSYSNSRAMGALVKASLQSILRSPSAMVFGIAFPLIFILVFGTLGGSSTFSIHVSLAPGSDTANPLYATLRQIPSLKWEHYKDDSALKRAMSEGDVTAQLRLSYHPAEKPVYLVDITGSSTEPGRVQQLYSIINNAVQRQDPDIERRTSEVASVQMRKTEVRQYKTIDFILPGQLGFSLLAGSVFGAAFVFFNLRQTLVLKRFFATPVRREVIVLSEGLARMIFQLMTAVIIIAIGHYAFGFTLIHGAVTFISLLALCALAVMVFMGFGFIVSSLAKNESAIPPFSNLITLPQFLLAGTFFPVEVFPKWLQPISRALPLTYLNHAMRQVAFYGSGFGEIKYDVLALAIWGIVLYVIASRIFKWE